MVGFKRMIKSHTIFIRFVISYVLVLAVTVIIGAIYYHQLLNIYTKDSVQTGLLSLNNGIQLVEARFAEVDNMVTQMMLDKEIVTLFRRNEQPIVNSDYYQFKLIQQKLKSYSLTNAFIDEVYLLMDDISVIISSKYVADRLPEFASHFMNYEDLDYASWKQQVMDEYHYMDVWPSRHVTKEHSKEAYITYVHSYPTGEFHSDQGAIVIHIKEEAFSQYFRNLSMMQNGLFLALDQNNDILASYNYNPERSGQDIINQLDDKSLKELDINGERFVVISTQSDYRGWTYVAAIPFTHFEEKTASIKKTFYVAISLMLLAGGIIALYMAYRNSAPLRKVIERLSNAHTEQDKRTSRGFNFLEGTVSQLIDYNDHLRQQLEREQPFIRASFMERLLRGGFANAMEIDRALSHAKITIKGNSYVVIQMQVKGYFDDYTEESLKDLDIVKLVATSGLQGSSNDQIQVHWISEDKIAIVYALNEEGEQQIESATEALLSETAGTLLEEYDARVLFGVGGVTNSLMGIARAFEEAGQALQYGAVQKGQSLIWHHHLPSNTLGYYYPLDHETRLIQCVKNGNIPAMVRELRECYTQNLEQRRLSVSDRTQLYYEIRGTVMKLSQEILEAGHTHQSTLDEYWLLMDQQDSAEGQFRVWETLFTFLCETVNQKKASQHHKLIDQIVAFIQEHYADSDLGLYRVASEFDLTEKYLSQFFKNHTGENFTNYVERIRMDQALELMRSTSLTIHEISSLIGYDQNNTFYRAFKRRFGVSPTTYRNQP